MQQRQLRSINYIEIILWQGLKVLIYQRYYRFQFLAQPQLQPCKLTLALFRCLYFTRSMPCLKTFIYNKMSFHGMRIVRQARKGSPIIFQSTEFKPRSDFRSFEFTFDLKPTRPPNPKNSYLDSSTKADTSPKKFQKKSVGLPPASKQKDRKMLIGNYINANLESLKITKPVNSQPKEPRQTERSLYRKNSKQEDYEEQAFISLKHFKLDFVVGKGGFGKVWRVREKNRGVVLAMKQMQKVKIISKRSVHSVMNQIDLLTKLRHPFLVNIVYAFQDREFLYLFMDYCNRGDLRYHLGNSRTFSEQVSRFFLACIVLCLDYMHSLKIMHRDLKPQNLVIDDRGYVRVTDLGVSRQVRPQNAQDTSGTPGYMAPEVICKSSHTEEVDYFALGVIAYEFMTGKRPYIGANRKQIREKILAKQVKLDEIPPFGWSRDSVDFINRLIQRKPDNRLGHNGIAQIKNHPFFKSVDWQKLLKRQYVSPFIPPNIQQDYANYKECISEDTQINDLEEYQLLLRHRDTQQAFIGYEFNTRLNSTLINSQRNQRESGINTALNIRKK